MEAGFSAAILDRTVDVPACVMADSTPRAERGFEVYRNNFRVSLKESLQATYPVTAQLVGDEFFAAMADVFISSHPPRSPVLIEYGGELPVFLDGFAPAATVPYLGDVARLEAAWIEAYHAPDAVSLQSSTLATLGPEELAECRVILHPSVRLVRSTFPVASIWEAHRTAPLLAVRASGSEDVLVLRPEAEVLVMLLQAGYAAFVQGLRDGLCIADAATAAMQEAPQLDVGSALVALLASGAVTELALPG